MVRKIGDKPEVPRKKSDKNLFFDFLREFKYHIGDFVNQELTELCISEIPVKGKAILFDGYTRGKLKIKNQGKVNCFLSTTGQGGYKLEPGETTPLIYVNSQVIASTVSGTAILGFIKT